MNFVAAYGTFPSVVGANGYVAKRTAAQLVVNPGFGQNPSPEAMDFINGSGDWANQETGINTVDLWMGGLAEATDINGGLLGRTSNYVFENSMTDLQNGDRFYYLARTPGMNLRAQLESNSFAELVMRNTDNTNTLKQDAFATADCKFQLENLANTAAGFIQFGSTVADDPTTECEREPAADPVTQRTDHLQADQLRRPCRHQRPGRLQRRRPVQPGQGWHRQRHHPRQRRRRLARRQLR